MIKSRTVLMAILAGMAAAPASAATPPGRAAVLHNLLECRTKTDPAGRLACYDAAASAMDVAETKGEIIVVDRAQAQAVRKQAFGFSLPTLAIFEHTGAGGVTETMDHVSGVVASAHMEGASQHWVIKLVDGAVWRQIDTEVVSREPKAGMAVEIKSAALSSFLLSVDKQRSFRAKREQ